MGGMREWVDPRAKVWGFHVHQEISGDGSAEFDASLNVQHACKAYFQDVHGVSADNDDAVAPGYGPHLGEMWELRFESITAQQRKRRANPRIARQVRIRPPEETLRLYGYALAWMAVNRGSLPAYVHPTMHDEAAPEREQLEQEGHLNQAQNAWFGAKAAQKQDFFFAPPLDERGRVVDTRTPRVRTAAHKEACRQRGAEQQRGTKQGQYRDPAAIVIRGFHIHVDFPAQHEAFALELLDGLLAFLKDVGSDGRGQRPNSTRIYGPKENGPHLMAGWEVKFEYRNADQAFFGLGVAVAWLLCNRGTLPIFAHPVTWEEGNFVEELKAHSDYSFFVGDQAPLDLGFFRMLEARRKFLTATGFKYSEAPPAKL